MLNAFSRLILDLYRHEAVAHARTAIGIAALPMNLAVIISAEVEIATACEAAEHRRGPPTVPVAQASIEFEVGSEAEAVELTNAPIVSTGDDRIGRRERARRGIPRSPPPLSLRTGRRCGDRLAPWRRYSATRITAPAVMAR